METPLKPHGLANRSSNYGDREFALYLRRSFAKSMGYSQAMLDKPVVGIADTGSDYNNCHRTAPELIEAVKRGVLAAGGLPLAFPTISICEPSLSPCSMHYRNLMALDTEAMLANQPMDAAVLVGGCDKTVPAQLMAAISAGTPSVMLVVGPMLAQAFAGERLSACTDCRRYWARYRAGEVSGERIKTLEGKLATTAGTCGVMGTASTMACIASTLGFMPLDAASAPAVHADRLRMAEEAGAQAVRLIHKPVAPLSLMTQGNLDNAVRVLLALGGSTNAVVHLAAIAGRAGLSLDLKRLDELSETTPVLVDLKPTGEGYMEDFHAAGGMQALLWEIRDLLDLETLDLDGVTLRDRIGDGSHFVDRKIIRARETPVSPVGGLVALFGSLAPDGAILKRSAATESLFETEARCLVFDGLADLSNRIDDPALDVTPQDILVLKNAGPRSPAGMPEAGYLPIPKKLARQGVKDMVRMSDCRMSGTAFGTIVLHIAPEAAVGGPLALVETGDRIRLSVRDRSLDLLVDAAELDRRRAAWTPAPAPARGWDRLVHEQVTQAPEGADLRFLQAAP
ncbi:dihydroxy-acid dehydratase [Falsiroseomonas selenitidurans]|uniref:Dihydroxy-acid dehydratase n=1 Tax=Falsiroseomonas selenitidurans TaxID=2716335 RepID=A0ABX1DWU7_9PROT|nr:dihydroxy-acid dehydratase [Falsiroseomonas selenitidurans]NKC29399.1 dihydroxy-acid dehydratase [Falsiroseomonas selenitidurans]